MAKKPKAIELVFKAQPMMALLLVLMKNQNPYDMLFLKDIENWLVSANELLKRKEKDLT